MQNPAEVVKNIHTFRHKFTGFRPNRHWRDKQHQELSNKNSLHETLYAFLFLTCVRQILMSYPYLA